MSPAFYHPSRSPPEAFRGPCQADDLGGHYPTNEATALNEGDEVVLMSGEVRRLDALRHPLNQERARLLREINDLQAATRHLPPDVLSAIFQFARPPTTFTPRPVPPASSNIPVVGQRRNPEDHFQLVFGAVSYCWRQVAWSTPQLWTTASIKAHQMSLCAKNASLLNLYFENSQGHPMAVELDLRAQIQLLESSIDARKREKAISLLEAMKTSVFIDNAARIRNLTLTGFPIEWVPFVEKNLPLCESITLHWTGPSGAAQWDSADGPVNLTGLPCLHHVRLEGLLGPHILPGPNITVLQFRHTAIDLCIGFAAKCPNLISLEVFDPRDSTDSRSSFTRVHLRHCAAFENLESLAWWNNFDFESSYFLENARFKKLRVLQLSGYVCDDPFHKGFEINPWAVFGWRLPLTLHTLKFSNISGGPPSKGIFISVPQVRTIHLADLSQQSILGIFRVLGSYRAHKGMFPPLLKTIIVDNHVVDLPQDDIAKMLRNIFYRRWEAEGGFHLELRSGYRAKPFGPRFLEDLRRLARGGFRWETVVGHLRIVEHRLSSIGYGGVAPARAGSITVGGLRSLKIIKFVTSVLPVFHAA